MRGAYTRFGLDDFLIVALCSCAVSVMGQNVYTPPPHVTIPNPTPRPPDLNQQFGDNPADQKKSEIISIQNQLRAREIWLESNQILLLAQQLQQEVHPGKKAPSMAANAAKVGQIEKLAQRVQEKMKTR